MPKCEEPPIYSTQYGGEMAIAGNTYPWRRLIKKTVPQAEFSKEGKCWIIKGADEGQCEEYIGRIWDQVQEYRDKKERGEIVPGRKRKQTVSSKYSPRYQPYSDE